MAKTSRSSCVMSTRMPSDTGAHFVALAARHHLSASSLLAKMIDEVLKTNGAISRGSGGQRFAGDLERGFGTADRVTLRLRPGDRTSVAKRARVRGMKSGTYLAMLIHNHVHDSAVLPPNELDQIRATGAQLAALGRQLRRFGMPNTSVEPWASELRDAIALVRQEVEMAREATAAVVRRNLVSWETGSEMGDA
jgi:hypothetical protein